MRDSSSLRGTLALLTCVALLGWASTSAHAQAPASQSAPAEQLFRDGRQLMADGRIDDACAKFEESQRLEPRGGTLLNLGLCHAKQGKLLVAWREINEVKTRALREGRRDKAQLAESDLRGVEARIALLTVKVSSAALSPGLRVSVDGIELEGSAWGQPMPLLPGAHRVVATAGTQSFGQSVEIRVGSQEIVRVPALAGASPSPSPYDAAPPAARSPRRTLGLVLGALGVAQIATGVVAGGLAIKWAGEVNDGCGPNYDQCTPALRDRNSSARTMAWVADITLPLGLICAGAGAYLWFSAPRATATVDARSGRTPAPRILTFAPSPLPGGGGLTMGGSF
jgi:hypothetical protein